MSSLPKVAEGACDGSRPNTWVSSLPYPGLALKSCVAPNSGQCSAPGDSLVALLWHQVRVVLEPLPPAARAAFCAGQTPTRRDTSTNFPFSVLGFQLKPCLSVVLVNYPQFPGSFNPPLPAAAHRTCTEQRADPHGCQLCFCCSLVRAGRWPTGGG